MYRVSSLALLLPFLASCHSATSDTALPAPAQTIHVGGRIGKSIVSEGSLVPGTGHVTVRAKLQKPDGILLPGIHVRVSMEIGADQQANL